MLSEQNIEAELSYAYLHAVASRAGFACEYAKRYLDDAGVDATIREDGRRLASDSVLTSFDLHIQLKATFQLPTEREGRYSYKLKVAHYDKLRTTQVNSPRLLVVLFLPHEAAQWLTHTEEALIARRCAYWVSLRNAPVSENKLYQTVYLPCSQPLSTETLMTLMIRFSRREVINYEL